MLVSLYLVTNVVSLQPKRALEIMSLILLMELEHIFSLTLHYQLQVNVMKVVISLHTKLANTAYQTFSKPNIRT